jgi:hypothetical protein
MGRTEVVSALIAAGANVQEKNKVRIACGVGHDVQAGLCDVSEGHVERVIGFNVGRCVVVVIGRKDATSLCP